VALSPTHGSGDRNVRPESPGVPRRSRFKPGCGTLALGAFLASLATGPCSPIDAHFNREQVDALCATFHVGEPFVASEFEARAQEYGVEGSVDPNELEGGLSAYASLRYWTMMRRLCIIHIQGGVVTQVRNFTHAP